MDQADPTEVKKTVRICVVEDEPLYRDLLTRAFAQTGDVEVVDTFASGDEAVAAYQDKERLRVIDAAVLDIQLPGSVNGLQAAHQLRRLHPRLGILFLSNHRHPAYLSAIDTYEARGFSYLLKRSIHDFDTVYRAIRGVASGSVVIDKAILDQASGPAGKLSRLTPRQREILDHVAQGYSNSEIARKLFISRRTVENHLARLYQEMGCETDNEAIHPRVHAVVKYLKARFAIEFGESP